MENTAQHAIELLRNRMTGEDMRQLSEADLYRLDAICHHWQAMAWAERKNRNEHHRRLTDSGKSGSPDVRGIGATLTTT